jgi:hypothetical protein
VAWTQGAAVGLRAAALCVCAGAGWPPAVLHAACLHGRGQRAEARRLDWTGKHHLPVQVLIWCVIIRYLHALAIVTINYWFG